MEKIPTSLTSQTQSDTVYDTLSGNADDLVTSQELLDLKREDYTQNNSESISELET
jgi:hypothetical protein